MPASLSTIRAVAAASSIVSGSPSRVDGTKDRTIRSVSESRNTSLMNWSGPTQRGVERPRACVDCTFRTRRGEAERSRAGGQALEPGAGRVHEVSLDVEDELAAVDDGPRELEVEGRLGVDLVEPAAPALAGVRHVHGQERAGRPARGHEEAAPIEAEAPRVRLGRLRREMMCLVVHPLERDRGELAVGRRVELHRQAPAVGIVDRAHGMPPRGRPAARARASDGAFRSF